MLAFSLAQYLCRDDDKKIREQNNTSGKGSGRKGTVANGGT